MINKNNNIETPQWGVSTKFLSLILCFSLLLQQTGLAQALPSLSQPQPQPLLRYLSVNSANPNNYFNFLMDKGSNVSLRRGALFSDDEAIFLRSNSLKDCFTLANARVRNDTLLSTIITNDS